MASLTELSSLKGKVAVITGSGGHLGRVIADTLAELGAELVLVDRLGTDLHAISSNLQSKWKITSTPLFCNLESEENRAELIQNLKTKHEALHILVNNAAFVGTSELKGWGVAFQQQSVETWRRAIEVNLTAVFELCKDLAPALRSGSGSIINIASIYGALGPDWRLYKGTEMGNPAAYAASKGGLIQLSRWLATTLAPSIRVNTISPGGIFRDQPEAFLSEYISRTPMQRMMTEDDVRGAIAYLASDLSAFVTGQNIFIDGGWSAW